MIKLKKTIQKIKRTIKGANKDKKGVSTFSSSGKGFSLS